MADVDRAAMTRLVVMYVRKARAVLIAIAEPMPRPRCVGRAAERPRCSTTSCEKESEVRSENDSEEEETYFSVSFQNFIKAPIPPVFISSNISLSSGSACSFSILSLNSGEDCISWRLCICS